MGVCDELKVLRGTERGELRVQNRNHRRTRFCRFTILAFSSDINEIGTDFCVKIVLIHFFCLKRNAPLVYSLPKDSVIIFILSSQESTLCFRTRAFVLLVQSSLELLRRMPELRVILSCMY